MADLDSRRQRPTLDGMRQSEEQAALLALLLSKGTGWSRVVEDVLDANDVWEVLDTTFGTEDALFEVDNPRGRALAEARSLLDRCASRGVRVRAFWEDGYPAALREIHEMPPIVFSKGEPADDRRAIAVVGSRRASPRGLEIAGNIAGLLAERGVTVVSGLAAGVDTAAHTAALRHRGRTVAVLGTGINRYYPPDNQALQDEIARRGMVLSQFLPDSPPSRQSFPMRNAVMSGYATATVVVEAGEHSGARIQARFALKHGRPVIFPRELLVNEWARDYARRPGVYVVNGLAELTEIVDEILAESSMTTDELVDSVETAQLVW